MQAEDFIVYSTASCGFCHALIDWLEQNKVPHTVKAVDSDLEAREEMLAKLEGNFQGVPVSVIKDKIVIGFDRNQIGRILKDNGIEVQA